MAALTPESSNVEARHHALTPPKVLRGLVCLVVLFCTAFIMIVYFGFACAVIVRLFSIHYSRKATSFFFGAWLALWPFLFEKINKTKVTFSGDIVQSEERILLIANHRTEVDWMYLWDLALRKGCIGYIKYVLKSSLMRLPVFGWAFHILEFIPVERKWEVDESTMRSMLSTFKDPQDPLWLALFPEGTDFTEKKRDQCQKYAAEHGLPILKHVLLPRTKGFCTCLTELRGSLDAESPLTVSQNLKMKCRRG
ncbi:probable 1-acyl-sn-glycerol-3-phosphate acyltransferase 5 isoform X2 [Prosopis cineraria]|uniref:probable 1-acyl-sn-glycerol-3-phosphate acyltransferase 5 isoform X2 n=1 Tax=Prosopis cineraria TaxID=364024 RepID=UPI00240EC1EF|nr:probable 1-acyl-sn-glycerol-3-phosphate acyltransferase 5 isoform X2 [Prosopis cineraria]